MGGPQDTQGACASVYVCIFISGWGSGVRPTHLDRSWLKEAARANVDHIVVTFDTSHLDKSLLNLDACENIFTMLVTLDTSHLVKSWLNWAAFANMLTMSVTADTSQFKIGPYGPLEQSPIGDALRHS